jgi:hypothetical protein
MLSGKAFAPLMKSFYADVDFVGLMHNVDTYTEESYMADDECEGEI